jgi:proteasome lid subunit RPN8/RPN11
MIPRIKIPHETRKAIKDAACKAYPSEMCGFIKPDLSFVQVENIAVNKHSSFVINAMDRLYHSDAIAIVHTHNMASQERDPRTPSVADSEGQKKSGLPWLIFACDGDSISYHPVQIPRFHIPELLGREFVAGFLDCYSLVQDYYLKHFDIELKDHVAYTVRDILRGNFTFSEQLLNEFGFRKLAYHENLSNGDVVILQQGINADNHVGVIHDGDILHQESISVKVPFEAMLGRIQAYYRYKDFK